MAVGSGSANLVDIIIRAIDQTKAAFASSKASIAATKTATTGLNKNLVGLNKGFNKIGKSVSGFGTKLKGLLTSSITPLIGVVGIAGIAIALNKAVKAFGSFEQAAANASSVTGATGAVFLETKKHIMDVSKVLGETTVFKASQAADAFYDLASAGYDVAKMTKNELKPILDLAAATQTDLKQTTEIVTSALGQFGMAIEDSKNIADVFARTIGSSKATMEKLGVSLAYVGPVAHALGRSLEETNAALGILYNKGFDASMAGTALRGAMARLMNPTSQIEEKLSELGVSVEEVNPELHSMADILDTLSEAGMDTADSMEIFGLRAGPAMLALTASTGDIRKLTLELENAGGAAAIMAEQQLTTFEGKMKLVHSKIEATALALGERLAPAILAIANTVTDTIIPAFGAFANTLESKLEPALGTLRDKLGVAFEKMTGGITLMQALKDVGVILGSTLRVLADALGWVIDKLNPLWDLIGKLHGGIGILADLLRTEADYTNDLKDAVELLNSSKAELLVLNEKLTLRMFDLSREIEKSNWGMETLSKLEADVVSAKKAHTQIQNDLNDALSRGDLDTYNKNQAALLLATERLEKATSAHNTVILEVAKSQIEHGTATTGVILAYNQVTKSTGEVNNQLETLKKRKEDAAIAAGKAAGAHIVLNDAILGVAKSLHDYLLRYLDQLIYDLGAFVDLIISISPKIERVLSFTMPGFDALKLILEHIIVLENDFADNTASVMDATVQSVSVAGYAISNAFELMGSAIKDFGTTTKISNEEASKSWEDRVTQIKAQLEAEKKEYRYLSDALKAEADKRIAVLNNELDDVQTLIGEEAEHFSSLGSTVEEVGRTFTETAIKIGDTKVTFEGLATEVLRNVQSFDEFEDIAQSIMDLDWSIFSNLEAALPDIERGILNMESAFAGLELILKDNIDSLAAIQDSVQDISTIVSPFAGTSFLAGIESIGRFAGAIKDAGTAINNFASLQDVSIEGCLNFSTSVYRMVSALEILEGQMEDLRPQFMDMNSLISDIADTFVYSGGRAKEMSNTVSSAIEDVINIGRGSKGYAFENLFFQEQYQKYLAEGMSTIDAYEKAMFDLSETSTSYNNVMFNSNQWLIRIQDETKKATGADLSRKDALKMVLGTEEERNAIIEKTIRSNAAVTEQMDIQTGKLKEQTEQLTKITEALAPYLQFMRTLNELAALSALSTDQLNDGFQAIIDTLGNLGTVLSTLDFSSVLEDLFREPNTDIIKYGHIFTPEHIASELEISPGKKFIADMTEYGPNISSFSFFVDQLVGSISRLVTGFETLAKIEDSVLMDSTKLQKVFSDMEEALGNLSEALGDKGFAESLGKAFTKLLKDAKPLMEIFKDKTGDVTSFNATLSNFMDTITHVIDTMQKLHEMTTLTLPDVTQLEAAFDFVKDAVKEFDNALKAHLELNLEGEIINTDNIIAAIEAIAETWSTYFSKSFEDTLPIFEEAVASFNSIVTAITSLDSAFDSLSNIDFPSQIEWTTFFNSITDSVNELNLGIDALTETELNDFFDAFSSIASTWTEWDEKLDIEGLRKFGDEITSITSAITGLVAAVKTISELEVPDATQYENFFKKIADAISEFETAIKKFSKEGFTGFALSLASIAKEWLEWQKILGDNLDGFDEVTSIITTLSNAISSLITIFENFTELKVPLKGDWMLFFEKLQFSLEEFSIALVDFTNSGLQEFGNSIKAISTIWTTWEDTLGGGLDTFGDASSGITGLSSSIVGLVNAFTSLAEMPMMTEEAFSAGMKSMAKNIENFASALKDNIETIEKALESVDEAWSAHAETMNKLGAIFSDATKNINSLAGGVLSLTRSFEALKDINFEKVFTKGFINLDNAVASFASALADNIDALLGSLRALVSAWMLNEDETVRLMRSFMIISGNFLIVTQRAGELLDAFKNLRGGSVLLTSGFSSLIDFMSSVIRGVSEIYTPDSMSELSQFVIDVGKVIDAFDSLERTLDSVMNQIKDKTITTINSIKSKVDELGKLTDNAYIWGQQIMISFISGLDSQVENLKAQLDWITDIIADWLGVGSNTKMGALSHLTDWPKNLMDTFAQGLKEGTPEISKALSALTLPIENLHMGGGLGGLLGAGGNNLTMYNTWYVSDQTSADYAVDRVEAMLTRRSVL